MTGGHLSKFMNSGLEISAELEPVHVVTSQILLQPHGEELLDLRE